MNLQDITSLKKKKMFKHDQIGKKRVVATHHLGSI